MALTRQLLEVRRAHAETNSPTLTWRTGGAPEKSSLASTVREPPTERLSSSI